MSHYPPAPDLGPVHDEAAERAAEADDALGHRLEAAVAALCTPEHFERPIWFARLRDALTEDEWTRLLSSACYLLDRGDDEPWSDYRRRRQQELSTMGHLLEDVLTRLTQVAA